MPNKLKQVRLPEKHLTYVDDLTFDQIKEAALKEGRTIQGLVKVAIIEYINTHYQALDKV